ncbi:MAG: chitobiase/beta-hexosaminidase C-terminal domain-containing protein [Spirochaetales bacterium]|nr:chitobiase/beta-hexosaminidase C-terminal domain-containing protein [Spirochaetales bacterium]
MKNFIFVLSSIFLLLFLSSCITNSKEVDVLPVLSPIGGVYKNSVEVEVLGGKGDKFYYTTNGDTPTTDSMPVDGKINIVEDTFIRVLSVNPNGNTHNIMSMYDIDSEKDLEAYTPSPVWTDQIIYFALLDRFYNGDKSNDDLGYNEFSTKEETWFSGGDLKGLEEKLDYIKELGATAIWITPPVKNEWSEGNYGGSHGYWASDFTQVDPHFGDLESYKSFVKKAHEKGMYVIQDIVVNHVGDYFYYLANDDKWHQKPNTLPTKSPEQLPWSLNNPSLFTPEELENNSFYHWTPSISDYNDRSQLFTNQLSNLDDLKTENPVVANLLRGYFRYWIDKVDVDAYRVDTVKYVEQEFFEEFVHSSQDQNKGIKTHAKDLGKDDFILFGESWDDDEDFNASYTLGENGEKRLDSVIYFNLNFAIRNVFGNGFPTAELSKVLKNRDNAGYDDPLKLVTFVDNHDMERLINTTTPNLVKSAYAFIMTIPGIPQIYYGLEQGFTVRRAAMFKDGIKDNGFANSKDYFDTDSNDFKFYQALIQLRKDNPVFRNGKLSVVKDESGGNGLFAYKLTTEDSEALVVFNTSQNGKVGIELGTEFKPFSKFVKLSPSSMEIKDTIASDKNGNVTIAVPGESFGIYVFDSISNESVLSGNSISIKTEVTEDVTQKSLVLSGTVNTPGNIGIFVDGNYNKAVKFKADKNWSYTMDLTTIPSGKHEITAFIDGKTVADYIFSNGLQINVVKPFTLDGSVEDEDGDEKYIAPTNSTFIHQHDIIGVDAYTSDGDLKLVLKMKATSSVWSPTINNFDHVLFNIFIKDASKSSGATELPELGAVIPVSMSYWNYFTSITGWSSSTVSDNQTVMTPSPSTVVDHENRTITVNIPGESLGLPKSLKGWEIYISTWDEDSGNLRGLTPNGGEWVFGGGTLGTDPLIMDDTEIIKIQ